MKTIISSTPKSHLVKTNSTIGNSNFQHLKPSSSTSFSTSISKAISKVPPFARAGLKKQMEEKQKQKEKLTQKEKEKKQKQLLEELLQMQNIQNNNYLNTTNYLDTMNNNYTINNIQNSTDEMTRKIISQQEERENISILNHQWENHRQHVRTARHCSYFTIF